MTQQALLHHRLSNQGLISSEFTTPEQVVQWMGAVQAQDFFGSLWSIGMRLKNNVTEQQVEEAVRNGSIIRTWPIRGTIHFVSPKDIRWMLKYFPLKVAKRFNTALEKDGIDAKTQTKAKKLWEKNLEGGRHLTRDEMY